MTLRVSGDDLKHANMVMRQPHELGTWDVCTEYKVSRGEEIYAKHPFNDHEDEEKWRTYRPLEDAPDLFLRLVAMHEAPSFRQAALEFSYRYGTLVPASSAEGSYRGSTSLHRWKREAERAWLVLKLYESVLNRDGHSVRRLHAEYDHVISKDLDPVRDARYFDDDLHAVRVGFADTTLMVQDTVQELCRPCLAIELSQDFNAPMMWEFGNLLGAMYLQMFWLVASGEGLGRCGYCRRTIFLSRPHPGARKRRSDRKFCGDACRQANHRARPRS